MNIGALVTSSLLKYLKKAWDKDRDHHYKLLENWQLLELLEHVPDYEGKNLTIIDNVIIFHPCTEADGATFAPDKVGKHDFRPGAIAHDIIYAEIPDIAKTFGWTTEKTRKWADNIFTDINKRYASGILVGTYHEAVRKVGWLAPILRKFFIFVLFLAILNGICGGCATQTKMFVDGEMEKPQYELVKDNDKGK